MTDPFISREDLAAYAQRTFDAGDDLLLAISLDSACQLVRSYIGQDVNYLADDEVLLDGTGTDTLLLPQLPVKSVSVVTMIEETGTGATSDLEETILVDSIDYTLGAAGILHRAGVWDRGVSNVKVKYSRGWDFTNDPTIAPPVPSDMRLVALQAANRIFSAGLIAVGGVQSESIGQYSYTLSANAAGSELTKGEMAVLSRYRERMGVA